MARRSPESAPCTVFKSAADRAAYLADYDRRLAALPLAVESRWVETRFGKTHLLLSGPEDGARLVVLHGGNGSGVDMAAAWRALAERLRVAWVDVPGDPNRSDSVRFDKGGPAAGKWLGDVLDGLQWETAAVAAMSGGGAHAIRAAGVLGDRIERLALMVPQGLAMASLPSLVRRVLWPLWRAKRRPDESNVRRLLAALCTGEVADETVAQFQRVLRHAHGAEPPAPSVDAAAVAGFGGPVWVVGGGQDVLFPGAAVLAQAQRVFRGEVTPVWVADGGHLDPRYFGGSVFEQMRGFLGG